MTSASTVACIVKVDRESLRVLDQNGTIRTILPSQVTNKITPRRDAVATDRNGAEIRNGDMVREVYNEQRSGVVLHIYRSYIFLHDKLQAENAGVVASRTANVVTVSAKGGNSRTVGPDLSKMNPAVMRPGSVLAAPQKAFGRDRVIGKTVSVRKGPFKGLVGIVKDASDDQARVELHSKQKLVTIPKAILIVKEYVCFFIKKKKKKKKKIIVSLTCLVLLPVKRWILQEKVVFHLALRPCRVPGKVAVVPQW